MSIRRAFSLVEVLIAITVLALGLLGLASIFPVVISQQRDAQSRLQAPAAIDGIRTQLLADSEGISARAIASAYSDWFGRSGNDDDEGRWITDEVLARTPAIFFGRGIYSFREDSNGDGALDLDRTVPATARIRPQPFSGSRPLFVFDLAVRGVSDDRAFEERAGTPVTIDRIEIAVFLRPIDPGIVVPDGSDISAVLTNLGRAPAEAVQPVGFNASTRLPTRDGTGNYAALQFARVEVDPDLRDDDDSLRYIRFTNATNDNIIEMATVPGQLLLDETGTVREVVAIELIEGEEYLRVTPPFPRGDGGDTEYDVVFAPTAPVRVSIVGVPAP